MDQESQEADGIDEIHMKSIVSSVASQMKPESVQNPTEIDGTAIFAAPLSLSTQVGRRQVLSDQKSESVKKVRDPKKFKVR